MDRLVSIVVPVYNAGAYIEETIAMVCRQTYEQWELLLVDDCSTDDGREKIEKWCKKDKRIRLIAKEKNEGAALTRNTGTGCAVGRYVAFLDADDIWHPEKLERELSFMKEKQAAPFYQAGSYTHCRIFFRGYVLLFYKLMPDDIACTQTEICQ